MCHNGAFRGHAERTSDGEVLVVDQPLDDLSARGCGGVKDDSGRLLAARRGQCGAEDRCARRGSACAGGGSGSGSLRRPGSPF